MKILQKPFTNSHKSAMFFDGCIARGKWKNRRYTLETYQDAEISFKRRMLRGYDIMELAFQLMIFDKDILSDNVEIDVDTFFAIMEDGEIVDDKLKYDNYDEAILEFKIFLSLK